LPAVVISAVAFFTMLLHAEANVAVTAAAGGGSISADTSANAVAPAWTTLGPITITEGANDDIAPGQAGATLILTAPEGFDFNTAQLPDVTGLSTDLSGLALAFPTAATLQLTLTSDGVADAVDTVVIGGVTPLQVRPIDGDRLDAGDILRDSDDPGTVVIVGIAEDVTSFGTLTTVPGVPAELDLSIPPSASTNAGVPFAQQPKIEIKDQFGSKVTSDNTTVVTVVLTTGAGTLSGTTAKAASGGVVEFAGAGLSIDLVGADKVFTFTAPGLVSTNTAAFAITAAAASPSTSTIQANPSSIPADGASTSTVTVSLRDALGNSLIAGGDVVVVGATLGAVGTVTDNGNGSYTATLTAGTAAGTATISATVNAAAITSGDPTVALTTVPAPSGGDDAESASSPIEPPTTMVAGLRVTLANTQSALVGSGAETVVSTSSPGGTSISVVVPADALAVSSTLAVSAVGDVGALAPQAPMPGDPSLVAAFVLSATAPGGGSAEPGAPAAVTFGSSPTGLIGTRPQELVLMHWDGGTWVPLPSTVSMRPDQSASLAGATPRFGLIAVARLPAGFSGEPAAPGISLLVTVGPSPVADLLRRLDAAGCLASTLAVTEGGAWNVHVAGAPVTVNARFPVLVTAHTPFFVRCR
jgi:adhesin/invasin